MVNRPKALPVGEASLLRG